MSDPNLLSIPICGKLTPEERERFKGATHFILLVTTTPGYKYRIVFALNHTETESSCILESLVKSTESPPAPN